MEQRTASLRQLSFLLFYIVHQIASSSAVEELQMPQRGQLNFWCWVELDLKLKVGCLLRVVLVSSPRLWGRMSWPKWLLELLIECAAPLSNRCLHPW